MIVVELTVKPVADKDVNLAGTDDKQVTVTLYPFKSPIAEPLTELTEVSQPSFLSQSARRRWTS